MAIKIPAIESGTYTPTPTGQTALDQNPVAAVCMYSRVGDIVTVSGTLTSFHYNSGSDNFGTFRLDLPIASNFTAGQDAAGTASWISGNATTLARAWTIQGESGTDDVKFVYASGGDGLGVTDGSVDGTLRFVFQYIIK